MNWPWLRGGRALLIGGLAGFPAGLVTLGLGSRLAMRVVALVGGSTVAGRTTDAGAKVGEITVGGSLFLIGAGAVAGVLFGAAYMALRRWMPHRGPIYGAFVAATASARIVSDTNPDFAKLGSPLLSIVMFAALGLLFGLVVVPLAEALESRLSRPPVRVPIAVAYTVPLALPVIVTVVFLGNGELQGFAIVGVAAALLAARRWLPRLIASTRLDAAIRFLLAAAAVAGTVVFATDVVQILRA